MSMTKRKSPLKEIIKESLHEMKGFPDDPTLAEQIEVEGPDRFVAKQKSRDEIVIDSLLADISGKDGYFIKLKKEIRPNEWMLMKVIENEWRRWADIETAVADIVREYTKKSPQKWGTGAYRVEIACRGGMRGRGYNPIDIYVNADEEFTTPVGGQGGSSTPVVDANTQVTSQLDTLAQLVNVVRGVIPTPQDPGVIQNQIAQAFQQGMQMKVAESSNSNQMVVAMMTAMMGMMKEVMTAMKSDKPVEQKSVEDSIARVMETLKTFGVLPTPNHGGKEKSLTDFITELKLLGIDVLKKDEPLEQISKLKQLASIAGEFMSQGQGEKPSILEKLIDVLGPAVPKMIEDAKEAFDKAAQAQALASQNIEKAAKIGVMKKPLLSTSTPVNTATKVVGEKKKSSEKDPLTKILNAIETQNTSIFPEMLSLLEGNAVGKILVDKAKSGVDVSRDLTVALEQYAGKSINKEKTLEYMRQFVTWVQKKPTGEGFEVICPKCQMVYTYATEQEFNNDPDKVCNQDGCSGVIRPIVAAKA